MVLWLVAGCVGGGRVPPAKEPPRPPADSAFAPLEPEATVQLGTPATAMCRDGDSLLVLESSGTRVVRLAVGDWRLATVRQETLPLIERITAPAGVAADRFYIYIYDSHTLYRMSKDKLDLQPWFDSVRVTGLAGFEPGIMLVSDADRGAIWYKGLFGDSRQFISAAEVARPGAMVALEDGSFAVLSPAARRIHFFNRSGVVTHSVSLPAACDLLAYDGHGTFCVGQRGKPQVWLLRGKRWTGCALPGAVSPLSLAIVNTRLVVLDAGTGLDVFRIGD